MDEYIMAGLIGLLILGGVGIAYNFLPDNTIYIKADVVCKVQDNSNYSNWCEYPCTSSVNEMIRQSRECSVPTGESK